MAECRYCGEDGLSWVLEEGKWCLHGWSGRHRCAGPLPTAEEIGHHTAWVSGFGREVLRRMLYDVAGVEADAAADGNARRWARCRGAAIARILER